MDQFVACWEGLEDPRTGNAGLHDYHEMLVIALCTVLSGGHWRDCNSLGHRLDGAIDRSRPSTSWSHVDVATRPIAAALAGEGRTFAAGWRCGLKSRRCGLRMQLLRAENAVLTGRLGEWNAVWG